MSEQWDFYFSDVEGKRASTFVNPGIHDEAPVKERQWLALVVIHMLDPDEWGLSKREEYEVVSKLEDAITDSLSKGAEALHVGRITYDGDRTMCFYAPREFDPEPLLKEALQKFPEYQCDSSCEHDPEAGKGGGGFNHTRVPQGRNLCSPARKCREHGPQIHPSPL
jgi:hypothetical protein